MMTGVKGPSISWSDFQRIVPNGTWVRQRAEGMTVTGLPLPIEGILLLNVDTINQEAITAHKHLRVTALDSVDPVVLYAGRVEFKIDEEWIDFRELCIRATERRLSEIEVTAEAHPLTWMTHKDELNMSVEQIGAVLYETALWIEREGNRGYSDNDLMKGVPALRIRILGNAYKLAWENILFFGDGSRKRDFDGWGVHKRTPAHWTVTWLERFGPNHPQAAILMDEIWDEALAEQEKRAVKRTHETYAGIDLEQAETRRSKKKTQAARDDWATAGSYFTPGRGFDAHRVSFDAHRFYTADYVEACCESDSVPDLAIGDETLPRGLREAIDVRVVDEALDTDEAEV